MNKNGFSLIEVLLYVAILAIVSGLFVGILSTSTKVQLRESANNEVSTQLNFVLQTMQRLVRESSNIEFACPGNNPPCLGDNPDTAAIEAAYIKLRMPKSADDPTCIAWVTYPDKSITLTQGAQSGAGNEHKCKDPVLVDGLISEKVRVSPSGLVITKFTNYPGHDSVQIDLTLEYNTVNPQSEFSKKLTTAIGRVSAATFDSGLFPGVSNLDIGLSSTRWQNLFLSGNFDVTGNAIFGGTISQGQNYDGGTARGFMVVGAPAGSNCNTLCTAHANSPVNSCQAFQLAVDVAPRYDLNNSATCSTNFVAPGGLCFCQ